MNVIILFYVYYFACIGSIVAFNSDLPCPVILGFDCRGFFVDTDERACDTNGVLYNNFCEFDQARCKDNTIEIDTFFSCLNAPKPKPTESYTSIKMTTEPETLTSAAIKPTTNTEKTTVTIKPSTYSTKTTTMQPVTNTEPSTKSTIQPTILPTVVTTSSTPNVQTLEVTSQTRTSSLEVTSQTRPSSLEVTSQTRPTSLEVTSQTRPSSLLTILQTKQTSTGGIQSGTVTSSSPIVTLDPLQQVFCSNKDIINCVADPNKVCGSDGRTYDNTCEFAKIKCDNPSLQIKQAGECQA